MILLPEEAYVQTFKFRPYKGTRKGRIGRVWEIAWFNMAHQWHRSRVLKVLIGITIFILIIPNMFLFVGTDTLLETKTANEILEDHLWRTIRNFVRFQVLISSPEETDPTFDTGYSILMLISAIMMGAGLISDDIKNKMSEVYYSKIDRVEYLFGKYGSLIIFGNLFYTLPCVIEWGLLIVGIRGVDVLLALPVLFNVILFTEVLTFVLTSIILAFSSLTQRRLYAGLLGFMFFLAMNILIQSLTTQVGNFVPIMYLDVFTALSVFSFMLVGETTVLYISSDIESRIILDLTGLAGSMAIPTIVAFFGGGMLICLFQVMWRHSRSL